MDDDMIIGIVLCIKLVLEPIWMGFCLSIGQVLHQHISNRMIWIDKLDVEGMAPTVPSFLLPYHGANIFVCYPTGR
ncbi:hypothetical protein CMK14_28605 [Candidatus Poribacteria bacterium]|nr:hypothetical protein [Candidatus Poribacteria bacterium]